MVSNAFQALVKSAKRIFREQSTTQHELFEAGEVTSPEMAAIIAVHELNDRQRRKASRAAERSNAPLHHSKLAVNLQGDTFRALLDEALTKAVAVALLSDSEIQTEWCRRK